MRSENVESNPGGRSEVSPNWTSSARRSSAFSFDFMEKRIIDDLTSAFNRARMRSSRSSEELITAGLPRKDDGKSSAFLYPPDSKHALLLESKNLGPDVKQLMLDDEKKSAKSSKLSRFLRRTQSAQDEPNNTRRGEPEGAVKLDEPEYQRTRKKSKTGTDIKFRLGFLKRRHTEGNISSVRPRPEEAQKWANSFNDLMASKYGQALFKAFLQREFSDENIEFWLAIEDYKKCRQNKLISKAQKIYNDFIIPQAPKEINLDSSTRDGVMSKLSEPTHGTFDQAQKRIQSLLESDAFLRFLQSDLYMELVQPEKYQSS